MRKSFQQILQEQDEKAARLVKRASKPGQAKRDRPCRRCAANSRDLAPAPAAR